MYIFLELISTNWMQKLYVWVYEYFADSRASIVHYDERKPNGT